MGNSPHNPGEKCGRPLLIVVSAPSGAGKTTLCNRFRAEEPETVYSISCTTRKPRGQEVNGQHYYFLSDNEFLMHVEEGDFLEYALVHGHRYGTLAGPVRRALQDGKNVLMDIDVQGAAQIRRRIAESPADDVLRKGFVDVFITPPSLDELRRRLAGRGEDSPATMEVRLSNARGEMSKAGDFKHIVVNDVIDEAFSRFKAILETEARKRPGGAS